MDITGSQNIPPQQTRYPYHTIVVDDSVRSLAGGWRAVVAELFGTLLFTFVSVGVFVASNSLPDAGNNIGGVSLVALGSGLAYMVLVFNFWNISGAHLNPVVTWGALITRRIGLIKGVSYIIAQIAGGILGALLICAATPEAYHANNLAPVWNYSLSHFNGFLLETVVTFIFVHTIFATSFDPVGMGRIAPIPIGLALTFGYFLTWHFTGPTTNPAQAFGLAIATGDYSHQWLYWLAPILGSTLASLIYTWFFFTRNIELAVGYRHHSDGTKILREGNSTTVATEHTRLIPSGSSRV